MYGDYVLIITLLTTKPAYLPYFNSPASLSSPFLPSLFLLPSCSSYTHLRSTVFQEQSVVSVVISVHVVYIPHVRTCSCYWIWNFGCFAKYPHHTLPTNPWHHSSLSAYECDYLRSDIQIISFLSLCVWSIVLSIMLIRFIFVIVNGWIPFF